MRHRGGGPWRCRRVSEAGTLCRRGSRRPGSNSIDLYRSSAAGKGVQRARTRFVIQCASHSFSNQVGGAVAAGASGTGLYMEYRISRNSLGEVPLKAIQPLARAVCSRGYRVQPSTHAPAVNRITDVLPWMQGWGWAVPAGSRGISRQMAHRPHEQAMMTYHELNPPSRSEPG